MELVSIFINIAIVIFILLGYRQLDKKNRSLEKVKKYSDKVKENLSQFIDEKSADIRNIAIEIKVNLKTHNEILNRIREEGDKFKAQTALVTDINLKFQDYDKILKELDHSTLIVEENLKRIQDESAFVDKVGKDINLAKDKIQKLEKEIPAIHTAFEKRNQENLGQLKESVLGSIKSEQSVLIQNVTDADKRVKDFAAYISRLESKKESMEQETIKNITKVYNGFESNAVAHKSKLEATMTDKIQGIYNTAKQAREKFEKDLQEIENKYQRHLQNIAEKGAKMEHDALNALKATIVENSKQFNGEIDKTFAGLGKLVEDKTVEINNTMALAQGAVNQCNAGIANEIDLIKNTFNEKFSHLKTDVNAKIEAFILGNREKQKSLTQELAGLNQFSEQKIEKFKTDFTKSIGEITSDLNSFKNSYLDKIKEAALAGEVEKEKLVHLVSTNLDNTKKQLTKNINDLQADIAAVEKLKETINKQIGETNDAFKINNQQILQHMDTFKAGVEKEIDHSTREMEARVLNRLETQLAEFETSSAYRIKKIEESNLDINSLEANINELLETRKADITGNFNQYVAHMEQQRAEEERHTREIITGLTDEIKTLENTLLELKTKAYEDVSEKLKGFEDEFFSDLRVRTGKMETSVQEWQAAIEETLEKTKQKYISDRKQVEEAYSKELDNKVDILKKKGETGIHQLLEFIKSEHHSTKEYAKKLTADIEKICSDIKTRYVKMKENAAQDNKTVEEIIKGIKQDVYEWKKKFHEEISAVADAGTAERDKIEAACSKELDKRYGVLLQNNQKEMAGIAEKIKTGREQILAELEEIRNTTESSKGTMLNIFAENDAKIAAWGAKIDAATGSYQSNFEKELALLRKNTGKEIDIITKDFAKQREELVSAANEEKLKTAQACSKEIEKHFHALMEESRTDLAGLGEQLNAAREQILTEYDDLKKNMQVSRNEILGSFAEGDEKIAAWQAKIDAVTGSYIANYDKELTLLKKNMDREIDALSREFAKQRDELVSAAGEERLKTAAACSKETEKHYNALLQASRADLANLEAQFNAAREQMSGEYEDFRKKMQISKSEILNSIAESGKSVAENDKKIAAWQAKIDTVTGSYIANYDKELTLLKKNMDREIDALSREFAKQRDELVSAAGEERMKAAAACSKETEKHYNALLQASRADLANLGAQFNTAREQMSGEYEDFRKKMQIGKSEILNSIAESGKSVAENDKKIAAWQTKIDTVTGSYIANFDKEMAALKKNAGREIEVLSREFAKQRDELVSAAGEERMKAAAACSKETEKHYNTLLQASRADLANLGAQFNAAREQLLAEYEDFRKQAQAGKGEIIGLFTESDEKITAWQGKIDTAINSSLATLNKELAGLKKSMSRDIDVITKDFTKQREDLALATGEERNRIKNDLKDFSARLNEFNTQLKTRTKEAFEEFTGKYTNFKTDIINSINTFQQETQERIAGFKKTMQDNNTAIQETQKSNMQKFELEYKNFRDKLKTIETQQQNFTEQTKLFERADKLKIMLKTAIDELKSDISKLEPEHQKMHTVEAELNKTKQAAEEVNGKLARFFAEKRRIDSMEKNFTRLIRISDDIGIKLENVTATKDILQEIQLKMRDLEKLENDIELKYDRLEKKDEIIEKTSKGIDKNFQSMEEIHTGLKALDTEYQALQPKMLNIKQELKFLTENKPKTDAVLKRIGDLSTVLTDIEQRMDKLQTAREWLSRTETRLENISKEAGDQVKLMQSIVKAEAEADKKRGKGAPPQDMRETVVKLANQGWSVKEISKATNISQGEVELILELAPAKR